MKINRFETLLASVAFSLALSSSAFAKPPPEVVAESIPLDTCGSTQGCDTTLEGEYSFQTFQNQLFAGDQNGDGNIKVCLCGVNVTQQATDLAKITIQSNSTHIIGIGDTPSRFVATRPYANIFFVDRTQETMLENLELSTTGLYSRAINVSGGGYQRGLRNINVRAAASYSRALSLEGGARIRTVENLAVHSVGAADYVTAVDLFSFGEGSPANLIEVIRGLSLATAGGHGKLLSVFGSEIGTVTNAAVTGASGNIFLLNSKADLLDNVQIGAGPQIILSLNHSSVGRVRNSTLRGTLGIQVDQGSQLAVIDNCRLSGLTLYGNSTVGTLNVSEITGPNAIVAVNDSSTLSVVRNSTIARSGVGSPVFVTDTSKIHMLYGGVVRNSSRTNHVYGRSLIDEVRDVRFE
jgi:hypothetical protein